MSGLQGVTWLNWSWLFTVADLVLMGVCVYISWGNQNGYFRIVIDLKLAQLTSDFHSFYPNFLQ